MKGLKNNLKGILALRGETKWQVAEVKKASLKGAVEGKEVSAYHFKVVLELPSLRGGKRRKEENVLIFKKDGEYVLYCYCGEKGICDHKRAVANFLAEKPQLIEEIERYLNGQEETGEEKKEEVLKDFHPLIRFAYKTKKPLLLAGPTGSGKTHTVLKLVRELLKSKKIDCFYQINLSGGIEDIDLLGKIIPVNGNWKVVDGELVKALKDAQNGKKVVVLLEELTRASQSARNLILKVVDTVGGKIVVNNYLTGETYEIDPENIWFIATANLGYSDTDELDPALRRRFVVVYKGYDEEAEKSLLLKMGYTPEAVDLIMSFTNTIRNLVKEEGMAPFDTGTLKDFATILKEDKWSALEYLKYKLPEWENSEPGEQMEMIERLFREYFD